MILASFWYERFRRRGRCRNGDFGRGRNHGYARGRSRDHGYGRDHVIYWDLGGGALLWQKINAQIALTTILRMLPPCACALEIRRPHWNSACQDFSHSLLLSIPTASTRFYT